MQSLNLAVMGQSLGQVILAVLGMLGVIGIIEMIVYFALSKKKEARLPVMLLVPAIIGLLAFMAFPILYEFRLGFSNMALKTFKNPDFGFDQFWRNLSYVFTKPVLKQAYFFPVFFRTIAWTTIQVFFHVTLGLMIAMLLNRPMKMRAVYRTIMILPWAVPQIVAVLAWRGEFHFTYGFFNIFLENIGLEAIQWKAHPLWNWIAMNITNIWLGVPFMMVILLGGLQSIPSTYYEAAEIDGANGWGQFKNVTIPMLQPVMTPSIILGFIWTFNNFNVPFFINENELETSDILVTALFRAAFQYNRYGFSAVFAIIIFLILLGFSVAYIKITNPLPELMKKKEKKEEMQYEARKKEVAA